MDHQDDRGWSWSFDRDDASDDGPAQDAPDERDERDDADFEGFLSAYEDAVEAGALLLPPFLAGLFGDDADDGAADDGDDGAPDGLDGGIPQFVVDSFLDRDGDGEVDAGDFVGFVPPFLQPDGEGDDAGDDDADDVPGFGFNPFAGLDFEGFGPFVPPFLQDDDADDDDTGGDMGDGQDAGDDADPDGDEAPFDFVFRSFLDRDGDGEFDAEDLQALIVPPFLRPDDAADDAAADAGGMDDGLDVFRFADFQDIA